MHRPFVLVALVALAFAAFAGAAAAAPFLVNVNYDATDAFPGNGICADAAGNCTLRASVMEANALPGWDDVTVPAGVFQLTQAGAGEDFAKTGDLDIRSELSITGQGPRRTTVDGMQSDRVFDVHGTSALLSGLGIRGGFERTGAGLRAQSSKLSMRWSAFFQNDAYRPAWPPLAPATGGGIHAYDGNSVLAGVSFFDNTATDMGGAIYLGSSATVSTHTRLDNVTVHANASRRGGGIFANNAPLTLRNDTIANNRATLGGGVYWLAMAPRSYNTIVAYNAGQDCSAAIVSVASNNDTDATCGFFGAGDLPAVDPLLGSLAYLGAGPFPTPNWVRPLLAGSPTIDAGDNATCTTVDERGQPRPQGPRCDIGAFEAP
jgi:predicted outer membrane repeat protein